MSTCSNNTEERLFLVTVDTEADNCWDEPERIELKNMAEIPRFQEVCEKHCLIPTYLVTFECATRDEALSVLKPLVDQKRCEIGHHLHVWTTPPFQKEEIQDVDTAWLHAYQSELPTTLFSEKAMCLKEAIKLSYGQTPTSHRAGRWGLDSRTLHWLGTNDFVVDSSVVPLKTYRYKRGKTGTGPDFLKFPMDPFKWIDCKGLMEIPLTVNYPIILSKPWIKKAVLNLPLIHILNNKQHLFGVQFRPSLGKKRKIVNKILFRNTTQTINLINFMVHSSELALGCSRATRNQINYESIWSHIEELFSIANRMGFRGLTLSEAALHIREKLTFLHKMSM